MSKICRCVMSYRIIKKVLINLLRVIQKEFNVNLKSMYIKLISLDIVESLYSKLDICYQNICYLNALINAPTVNKLKESDVFLLKTEREEQQQKALELKCQINENETLSFRFGNNSKFSNG